MMKMMLRWMVKVTMASTVVGPTLMANICSRPTVSVCWVLTAAGPWATEAMSAKRNFLSNRAATALV